MIPQISETRERRDVHAHRGKMALGPGGAKSRHAQIDNIRLYLTKLVIRQPDAADDFDAVIVQNRISLGD
jgi:hypothetical protein